MAGWLAGWHNFSSMGGGWFVRSFRLFSFQTVCFRILNRVRPRPPAPSLPFRQYGKSSTSEFHLLPPAGCT